MAKSNNGNNRKSFTESEYMNLGMGEKKHICAELRSLYQDVVDYAVSILLNKSYQNDYLQKFEKYYGNWMLAENLNSENRSLFGQIVKARDFLGIFTTNTDQSGFDLRYQGEPIALIKIKNGIAYIEKRKNTDFPVGLTKGKITKNTLLELQKIELKDSDDEKKIEFLLLDALKSTDATSGIRWITPIMKPEGVGFIQFPSTFNASVAHSNLSEVCYSTPSFGRGIDILARQKGNTLLVIEVKDEHKNTELPEDAVKQAILYATELSMVLRRNKNWFEHLLKNKPFEKSMLIKAVIAMPFPNKDNDIKGICTDFQHSTENRNKLEIHTGVNTETGNEIVDRISLDYIFFKKPDLGKGIDLNTKVTSLQKRW